MSEIELNCRAFMRCLDERRFFDAHEVFESVWFPRRFDACDEVLLLKGFINASISFELLRRGRVEPARRVWKTYLKYVGRLERLGGEARSAYTRVKARIEQTRRDHEHLYGRDEFSPRMQTF